MARGKRCAFPTAHPQAGGCPQAPQPVIIIYVHGGKIQGERFPTRHCLGRATWQSLRRFNLPKRHGNLPSRMGYRGASPLAMTMDLILVFSKLLTAE
ncbi:MAG: hypothetical protein LBE85_09505, partial [Candidatus Accumulibacter sp.]|jgi:hypothetical protein|nr:hypothetical protein [Accumulibacter sp.]